MTPLLPPQRKQPPKQRRNLQLKLPRRHRPLSMKTQQLLMVQDAERPPLVPQQPVMAHHLLLPLPVVVAQPHEVEQPRGAHAAALAQAAAVAGHLPVNPRSALFMSKQRVL